MKNTNYEVCESDNVGGAMRQKCFIDITKTKVRLTRDEFIIYR